MELNQERTYEAEPDRVFAALIHVLAEGAAEVVAVEEFGTVVLFRFRAAMPTYGPPMSARVEPASGGTRVEVTQHPGSAPSDRAADDAIMEPAATLFEAVLNRLDHGPRAPDRH